MQLIRQMNLEERRGLQNILVTGSHGLIGKAVTRLLSLNGYAVRTFDCRLPRTCPNYGDVADGNLVHLAAQDVDAIIHLAAISRVQWGDLNPDLCWQTNVVGTENVVRAAAKSKRKPVLIVASSREVYGEPIALPVDEDTPAAPVNL
jgi:UDP-glucose 4-epimerase